MASVSTVITRGYGSLGSINLLPTRGYGVGSIVEPVIIIIAAVQTYAASQVTDTYAASSTTDTYCATTQAVQARPR